jgi:hypothetical protein
MFMKLCYYLDLPIWKLVPNNVTTDGSKMGCSNILFDYFLPGRTVFSKKADDIFLENFLTF